MAHLHKALDAKLYHQALVILGYTSSYDQPDENGLTPLVKCCKESHNPQVWSIIRELVLRRARLNLKDEEGRSILHLAVCNKSTKVTRLLISTGNIDLQSLDNEGNTPLHIAASVDAVKIAKSILVYLLHYQMDVDMRNKPGLTPLMLACKHGHLQTARLLVQLGCASLTMKDNVRHKSAKEWLEDTMAIPLGVDPFTCDPEALMNKQCKSGNRIHSAKTRAVSAIPDPGRLRRVQSAPPIRMVTAEFQLQRPATHGGWVGPAERKPCCTLNIPSIKQQLRPLFDVYSIQESSSYRPSAVPPKPPTPPPSPPKSPKSQARHRLQKFIRLKRAESIVKALSGQKRQQKPPKSSYQDVIMAALRRKSPKPEAESRKSPMHDGKDPQETRPSSSNRRRFVSGVRRVVQMETIDHDSEEET